MRIGAERAAAIGDDLGVGRQLGEASLELVDRNRTGAFDVTCAVLVFGPDVDEHDVAVREALEQFVAADRVDVLAEVLVGCAFDLGQLCGGGVA